MNPRLIGSYDGNARLRVDGESLAVHARFTVHIEQLDAGGGQVVDGLMSWGGMLTFADSADVHRSNPGAATLQVSGDATEYPIIITSLADTARFTGSGDPPPGAIS